MDTSLVPDIQMEDRSAQSLAMLKVIAVVMVTPLTITRMMVARASVILAGVDMIALKGLRQLPQHRHQTATRQSLNVVAATLLTSTTLATLGSQPFVQPSAKMSQSPRVMLDPLGLVAGANWTL